jgi:ATP-dependent DNA ligase
MDTLLPSKPTYGKERNDILNAILNRSRKRKPANQNQQQTRKNKNSIQSMLTTMKKSSPEYTKKQNWLKAMNAQLEQQRINADGQKPKRKFKVRESMLETTAEKALEKTADQLKANAVIVPPSPKNALLTVTPGTKKRVFKVRSTEVVAPLRPPTPPPVSTKAAFPILYTKSKTGKVQQWQIDVKQNGNGTATITSQWGYKDGKLATSEKEITEGKNKGKSNETTPYQQAVSEAQSAWEKKTSREGYAEKIDDAALPGVAEGKKVAAESVLYPMLAQNYRKQSRKVIFPCYVQAKLDGVRSLYRNGVFTSRTAKPLGFLEHITRELKSASDAGLILDGELYSSTLSFQEFVGLVKKKQLTAKDKESIKQVKLWVYDIVNEHPFEQRLAFLVDFFSKQTFTNVHLLPTEECKTKDDIKKFHDTYVAAGYEGVIIRNKKGLYRLATRSEDLQKFKEFEDAEFTIVGFTEGEGNEKGAVIWICETEDKKQFRVRPKGTVDDRKELFKKGTTYVGKKLTVKYQELTDDGIPRFPVGLAIRDYE